jgi:uncharacterized membrane protein (GlpM family)
MKKAMSTLVACMANRTTIATTAILLLIHLGWANTPYTTRTLGIYDFAQSQDAYVPRAEINLPSAGPEDLFIASDGTMYVADTGNGRILKMVNLEVVASYGEGLLQGPSSIFVDDQGTMYIADAKQNAIVILDDQGQLVNQFGRPSEPLFGKNRQFLPRKIAVDARQNLFIISESSVDGIVQMNTRGNFIGYFGANTATMSLKMILQRLFLTKEQLDQFIKNTAASPSNLTIDHQSLIFTVTAGTSRLESIRRFSVAGKNIMRRTYGSSSFRDIAVSPEGLIIAVDADGRMYEYDLMGRLLFIFGAQDTGEQRLGTLRNPTAIARWGEQLFVLDKDKNAVVIYDTTAFAKAVHQGVSLHINGFYQEAKPHFENILNYNGSFVMAYGAIGDAYFKEQDYPKALLNYRYGDDVVGYSQTFWELRNVILQKHLSQALLGLFGFSIMWQLIHWFDRRYAWLKGPRQTLQTLRKIKWMDDLAFMFRFIRQPVDSFYYIKKDLRGSLGFAIVIYIWIVIARILSLYVTGFIFSPYYSSTDIKVANEIAFTVLPLVLWNLANYLISSINDGEGRLRDVVIGTAYSLFPYAFFVLPIALFSRVLTFNERFLYTFPTNLMWLWVGIMLFIMVKEVHNYTFGETVKNILLTLFTMVLFVLSGYILYVLFSQLFGFIWAVWQEVRLRV